MVSYVAMDQVAHNRKTQRAMRIGILTFHSQINYGAILQAYALQEVLSSLGHDVMIIDRWMGEGNSALKGISANRSIKVWVKFLIRAILGFGDALTYIRHRRTFKKLPHILKLTPYHFFNWQDAPNDLGVDLIIVGSDQVWKPELQGSQLPYLLFGAPNIPAIAYAASFGLHSLPSEFKDRYETGLKRFKAISVREQEGIHIVNSLGHSATHVLDPTLLADISIWQRLMSSTLKRQRKRITCYFVLLPLGYVVSALKHFANMHNYDIDVFFAGPCIVLPSNVLEFLRISTGTIRSAFASRIHTHFTATPDEFVSYIYNSDGVITDSFHATMFSTIFNKNLRVLRPMHQASKDSFNRISEFVQKNILTNVLCDNVSEALESIANGDTTTYDSGAIDSERRSSLEWLTGEVSSVNEALMRGE